MSDLREVVRSAWLSFTGPDGWRAVFWPAVFAVAALGLLIYDHLQDRITHLVFWLCVVLIACVFAWLVETARRKALELAAARRQATRDSVTGLPNRGALLADLDSVFARQRERRALVMFELEGVQAYYDAHGTPAGDALVGQLGGRLVETIAPLGGSAYRVDPTRLAVLVPDEGRPSGEILLAASSPLGGDDGGELSVGRSFGEVRVPDEANDSESALQIAGQRVNAYKQRQQRSARRQAHAVLMAALAARRPELREHLRTVAYRSISVSRRLGLDRGAIDDVFLAAELEDIGLLAVPESVLEKRASLSAAEVALIRDHPVAGERIVSAAPGLASVAAIIRAISERFDGSGHPDGLAGEAIPVGARIIAVCVAFAAMTSARPFQPARSESEALGELRRCAGSQFDPTVVEALAADLAEAGPADLEADAQLRPEEAESPLSTPGASPHPEQGGPVTW